MRVAQCKEGAAENDSYRAENDPTKASAKKRRRSVKLAERVNRKKTTQTQSESVGGKKKQ